MLHVLSFYEECNHGYLTIKVRPKYTDFSKLFFKKKVNFQPMRPHTANILTSFFVGKLINFMP